jgi:hypothetical protein
MQDHITTLINQLGDPDSENTFFQLLEEGKECIPLLIEAYSLEESLKIRVRLLEVIWQIRNPDILSFLAEQLRSAEPEIWKMALDGIVALRTPFAATLLQAEIDRVSELDPASERLSWFYEALNQLDSART